MAIIPGIQNSNLFFADPQKSRQKKLIYLLVAILVATAAIYFLFYQNSGFLNLLSPVTDSGTSPNSNSQLVESLKKANLNFSFLNSEQFRALILHGNLPVVVGEKGRDNPFASF